MIELVHGDDLLAVDPLGAVIRGCRIDGIWVMPDTRQCTPEYAAGEQLFPWPNRLRNGRWLDGDTARELALTEPARNNAIHGLLRDVSFATEHSEASLVLRGELASTEGYPWSMSCEFVFTLAPHEVRVRSTFRNLGTRLAPWAFGSHPYLSLPGTPETVRFWLGASTVLDTDEQMIPAAELSVNGSAFDFRAGTTLSEMTVDHAFRRDEPHHPIVATLESEEVAIDLWADSQFGVVQVFRPPADSALHAAGPAIAVEPMTAPADALNSGDGLRWLEPGESVSLDWGVRLR